MQTNTFRIPFLFIGAGLFFYILFNLAALVDPQLLMKDSIRVPYGWSLAHLGVLGWASMVAMGAIYQLLQVVVQRQVYSERLAYVHFMVYILGVAGMVYAFYEFNIAFLSVSAGLVAAGICLFVYNILATMKLASKWNSITIAVVVSTLALLLTALSGTAMGVDFGTGFLGDYHQSLLHSHIWLGIIGWFGLLIVGFSFKLLPMFLLAHNYSQRFEPWIVTCLALGTIGMAIALLLGLPIFILWFGLFVITVGFVLYWLHVENMIKHRHKANPGSGIRCAIWIVRATTGFLALLTILLALFPALWEQELFIRSAFYLYLLLWVNGSVLSYMSKIVPFLWWTHRYSNQMGKPGVPAMAQLLPEKSYTWILQALLICHLLFGLNMLIGIEQGQLILQVLISLLSSIYAIQLALVFRR